MLVSINQQGKQKNLFSYKLFHSCPDELFNRIGLNFIHSITQYFTLNNEKVINYICPCLDKSFERRPMSNIHIAHPPLLAHLMSSKRNPV